MDKLQQIKLPIDKEFEEFRRLFDSSLQSSNSLLSEVLSYIKQRNGKMMRPILALLIAKLFGEINDSTLHAALSFEMVHLATLVHDDVVDGAEVRRNRPTLAAKRAPNSQAKAKSSAVFIRTSSKYSSRLS
jgi:octaprenyl-diphosphate synthase